MMKKRIYCDFLQYDYGEHGDLDEILSERTLIMLMTITRMKMMMTMMLKRSRMMMMMTKIRMGWSVIVAGVDCDLDEIPSEQRGLEFYHYADV